MNNNKFNEIMHYVFLIMFSFIIVCEIRNQMNHTKMVNKIGEISEKVGIECNVETNDILFTSIRLK